jgi:RNA recognition motif-containing protein
VLPLNARKRFALVEDQHRASFLAGVSDSMGRRLYVGNLPYSSSEDQLTELFSRAGKVDNVRVMRDMATGRARGFAFVEMSSDDEAQRAISELHEHQLEGRALVVNEARPKPEGGFSGGGRGRGGGFGGSGGGNRGGDDFGGRRKEPRW